MTAVHSAHDKRWEVVAAFAFGCAFLVVILLAAWFRPTPTPFEYTVFRITISLAAAGIGAILPGFLDVRFKNWLRAGGALALFVVVYFFSPAALPSATIVDPPMPPAPTTDAKRRADEWLALVDQGKFEAAYSVMAQGFRAQYPYSQFQELVSRERASLGNPETRQFVATAPYESPPGAPKGHYRQYNYKTRFDHEKRPIYEVVWLVGEKDDWRVSGFFTMVKTEYGQFVSYEPN